VPDVEAFPGHIACSSLSRSEIVVPVFAAAGSDGHSATATRMPAQKTSVPATASRAVVAVLDIDSKDLDTFDATDALWLEKICKLL
jgi:GAF domain-containing protein